MPSLNESLLKQMGDDWESKQVSYNHVPGAGLEEEDRQYAMNQVGGQHGIGGASQQTSDSVGKFMREGTQLESFVSSHVQEPLDKEKIAQLAGSVHSDLLNHARVALSPEMEQQVKKLVQQYRQENPNVRLTNPADEAKQQATPIKIGDLRSTLNGRMDETIAKRTELNQKRDLVAGDPLTKPRAEKLAASDHVNGADKLLDQQAQELQIKRDKLSQYEQDIMKYGKENGLDKTLWRHAPEIFKGEGLKYYESSMVAIENNHKFYNGQETTLQTKMEQLQERLQTPEARSEIAKKSEEYLAKDKERLVRLEALDRKLNELQKEQTDIIALKNALPSRKLDNEINVQGDAKDVKNLLGQSDLLTQQGTEIKQAMALTSGRSRSL